jgi:hypothetical protein
MYFFYLPQVKKVKKVFSTITNVIVVLVVDLKRPLRVELLLPSGLPLNAPRGVFFKVLRSRGSP